MEETVYQCPECNFNADNITELDMHLNENHSGEATSNGLTNPIKKSFTVNNNSHNFHNNNHLKENSQENFISSNKNKSQSIINKHDDTYVNDENLLIEDDDEDFFNEKNTKSNEFEYIDENNEEDELPNEDEENYNYYSPDDTAVHGEEDNYNHINTSKKIFDQQSNKTITNNHEDFSKSNYSNIKTALAPAAIQFNRNLNQRQRRQNENVITTAVIASSSFATAPQSLNNVVLNSDNHYERQYACKRCEFFTNNPRAVLYHRKEFHMEKINVHECAFCQYASQYSGKVERHTMLRHKIDVSSPMNKYLIKKNENSNNKKVLNKNDSLATQQQQQQQEEDILEKSSNSLSLNESFVNNALLMKHDDNRQITQSQPQQHRSSQYQTYQTRNLNNSFSGAKFQCNKCPCKYKRSNDLSKHLKLKHSIHPTNLNGYLTNVTTQAANLVATEDADAYDETDESYYNDLKQKSPAQSKMLVNRNFNQVQRRNISQNNENKVDSPHNSTSNPVLPIVLPKKQSSYECPYCTYQSNGNDAEYLFHVKDHLCGKTFRCVLCNSVYKYRGDCVVHLKRKHQKADTIAHSYVDKFNLDNLDITQINSLLKPKQNDDFDNEEKLFGCAYCDYKANYKGDVFKHQTRRHPGTVKSVTSLGGSNANNIYNNNHNHNGSAHSSENNSVNNSFNCNGNKNNPLNNLSLSNYAKINNNISNNINNNQSQQDEEDYDDDELIINPEIYKTNQNGNGFYLDDDDDDENCNNYQNMNGADTQKDYQEDNDIINCDDPIENDAIHDDENNFEDDEDFFNERSQGNTENTINNKDCIEDDDEFSNSENQIEILNDDYVDDGVNSSGVRIGDEDQNIILDSLKNEYQNTIKSSKSQCKFCSFIAKSPAKLQLHLATHYNLKPFMCPVCKRRANFKWDIQKHLRKIHNDHKSEVICLSETEARKSINSYIEHKQFVHNNNANAIIYENSVEKILKSSDENVENDAEETIKCEDGDENDELENEVVKTNSIISQPNFRLITGRHNPHAIRERKFKCPMCIRTSKWQWDIKKHMRTVHKGRDGDVIVLKERNYHSLINSYNNNANLPTLNSSIRSSSSGATNGLISNSLFKNGIVQNKVNTTVLADSSVTSIGSDATGNKKFKCSSCPYRSNWKADLIRHVKKRHFVSQPSLHHIIILKPEEAARTLPEYERLHGINIRKRIRLDNDGSSGGCSEAEVDLKRYKSATEPDDNTNTTDDNYMSETSSNHILDEKGVERLPVSVAELNIKPYKCLRCGFRSDRKSDTLRHIKVKHSFQQPFSLLKILSIKDASSTIEQYERTKASKKVMRTNANNTSQYSASPVQALSNQVINQVKQEHSTVTQQPVKLVDVVEKKSIEATSNKQQSTVLDYYKCPFCTFKHLNKLTMRRHLFIHYRGETIRINPIYRCNTCSFKSQWQYTVKNHIITCHLSMPNVNVVKLFNKDLGIIKLSSKPSNKMLKIKQKPHRLDNKIDGKDSGVEEQDMRSVCSSSISIVNTNNNNAEKSQEESSIKNEQTLTINQFCNEDDNDESCIHYEDENDEYSNQHSEENNENVPSLNNNDEINEGGSTISNAEEFDDTKVESTSLTGYDGVKFVATYLVVMSTINNIKKKMYQCQACPYKTNNFCNLKQHLLQHKFQEGYYKCRYCSYYVVKIRLLKQHETLHNEYEPRENSKRRITLSTAGYSFPQHINTNYNDSNRYNTSF